MSKQNINVGSAANDGTGDPLRNAMIKINANDTEEYNAIAAVQADLSTSQTLSEAFAGASFILPTYSDNATAIAILGICKFYKHADGSVFITQ